MRRRKRGELPRMIVDSKMCLRVADGDDREASPSTPMHCPECKKFSGKLMFATDKQAPVCEDHDPVVVMVGR